MKGQQKRGSPRKPADQRHRPARSPHVETRISEHYMAERRMNKVTRLVAIASQNGGGTGARHAGTPLANHRLVTYSPTGRSANRESFAALRSDGDKSLAAGVILLSPSRLCRLDDNHANLRTHEAAEELLGRAVVLPGVALQPHVHVDVAGVRVIRAVVGFVLEAARDDTFPIVEPEGLQLAVPSVSSRIMAEDSSTSTRGCPDASTTAADSSNSEQRTTADMSLSACRWKDSGTVSDDRWPPGHRRPSPTSCGVGAPRARVLPHTALTTCAADVQTSLSPTHPAPADTLATVSGSRLSQTAAGAAAEISRDSSALAGYENARNAEIFRAFACKRGNAAGSLQRWKARARETGGLGENPPASGIVRHDSHNVKIRERPRRGLSPVCLGRRRAQEPVTAVQPGETECIPTTHKRAFKGPITRDLWRQLLSYVLVVESSSIVTTHIRMHHAPAGTRDRHICYDRRPEKMIPPPPPRQTQSVVHILGVIVSNTQSRAWKFSTPERRSDGDKSLAAGVILLSPSRPCRLDDNHANLRTHEAAEELLGRAVVLPGVALQPHVHVDVAGVRVIRAVVGFVLEAARDDTFPIVEPEGLQLAVPSVSSRIMAEDSSTSTRGCPDASTTAADSSNRTTADMSLSACRWKDPGTRRRAPSKFGVHVADPEVYYDETSLASGLCTIGLTTIPDLPQGTLPTTCQATAEPNEMINWQPIVYRTVHVDFPEIEPLTRPNIDKYTICLRANTSFTVITLQVDYFHRSALKTTFLRAVQDRRRNARRLVETVRLPAASSVNRTRFALVGGKHSSHLVTAAPIVGERRKREIPEKARRPTASFDTIPICESPVTRPGIEPGSPWREASRLTAQPPRPLPKNNVVDCVEVSSRPRETVLWTMRICLTERAKAAMFSIRRGNGKFCRHRLAAECLERAKRLPACQTFSTMKKRHERPPTFELEPQSLHTDM
ncbi:hypothetical protein PR048_028046 [Dryococelus australis]|uniref:Uncharacterized protein n=1 Tax=Dryococelus australis TaxID=614101 RepID=A0ABQ9GI66_9NEOP|nr:hypothetical protein PR048_028046 [Dryococelus australis]